MCGVDDEEGLSMEMEEREERRKASRRSMQKEKVKKKIREISGF